MSQSTKSFVRLFARPLSAGLAALLSAVLSGCALTDEAPEERVSTPQETVAKLARLPEGGSGLCLKPGTGYSPSIDLTARRAFADRGFRVRLLARGEEPEACGCAMTVRISVEAAWNPTELPRRMALDYTDLVTGEAKRAAWSSHDEGASSGNAFRTGPYGDTDRLVRELVDRLFPQRTPLH